jgi:hypothetical protein
VLIGFYEPGPVKFPHRPYPKATLRVVEKAIAEAWRIIRDNPGAGFNIVTADENRITRELRTCLLNQVLDGSAVPAFTSKTFDVNRGSEFESYDGTHLQKKPDLHFAIRRDVPRILRSADGLFVECKPVDADHPVVGDYCDKGIIRFVNGEYAWAMSIGYMVGYAKTGYALPDKLKKAVNARKKVLKHDGQVRPCPDTKAKGYTQHPHITIHKRGFRFPITNAKATAITLRHLWFDRN